MLDINVVRIILIISFIFFGYDITYIIIFKKRNKNNEENVGCNKSKETKFIARMGIHLINIFILICCLNIFIYPFWIQIFPYIELSFFSGTVQVIGFTIVISGCITLLIAYRKLGIYWSYPIDGMKKRIDFVKTGIYGKIRHPIYLSFNLLCIGYVLLFLDWFLLVLYLFGAFGLYIQAKDEERILIEYFGEEYLNYMKKTGRFFVKIKKRS